MYVFISSDSLLIDHQIQFLKKGNPKNLPTSNLIHSPPFFPNMEKSMITTSKFSQVILVLQHINKKSNIMMNSLLSTIKPTGLTLIVAPTLEKNL